MSEQQTEPQNRFRRLISAWRGIFRQKDDDLAAVRALIAGSDRHVLARLLAYTASPDAPVANAAAAGIAEILGCQTPRQRVATDEQMRDHFYLSNGEARHWTRITPAYVPRFRGSGEHAFMVLGVASMHPNGHVREAAVRELDASSGGELPYLLVRLNDWVEPVRRRAREAVRRRLTPEYAPRFVRDLWLVERLAECGRDDHESLVEAVHSLLVTRGRGALLAGLEAPDRWLRRTCYRLLLEPPGREAPEVVLRALADEDNIVRLRGVRWGAVLLEPQQLLELLPALLRDPFARVREDALRLLSERAPDRAESALWGALLDPNATVRDMARRILARNGQADFVDVYRGALGRETIPALHGLAETGRAEDAALVEPFLTASAPRVRRAAVAALGRLAPDASVPHLVRALEDGSAGVSRVARIALAPRAGSVGAEALWRLTTAGGAEHVRVNALLLLAALAKWESIAWLVCAQAHPDPAVSERARRLVTRWIDRFNRSGSQPTREQIERAARAVDDAAPMLGTEHVKTLRFLMKGY